MQGIYIYNIFRFFKTFQRNLNVIFFRVFMHRLFAISIFLFLCFSQLLLLLPLFLFVFCCCLCAIFARLPLVFLVFALFSSQKLCEVSEKGGTRKGGAPRRRKGRGVGQINMQWMQVLAN